MSVGLTDGPTEDYSAVYVTIAEIQVNQQGGETESGWVTIAEPNRTYNLLDLTDGVVEGLGEGPLEAGSYNQIRMIIGTVADDGPNLLCHSHPFANYVIDADDQEIHELTVPSGEQTGLKIICAGKCDVVENQTTELILDFDAAASVVVAGNSGTYNLKPTIKLLETQDFTLVTGRILTADGAAIVNAEVSAQIFNPAAIDPVDRVLIQASTLTDVNGDYQLFVRPGDYNLVATATGFETAAVNFSAVAGSNSVQDFTLAVADTGTVGGILNIAGADADTFAFLSLEQELSLGGLPESVEVESLDILNGTAYSAELAAGSYDAVAATCGLPTQEAAVEVTAGAATVLDFNF
ncbi:MAG TPA: DUF4382 domain-containing protein [bacterium]|nr:DUF4382 domain-containing protein [bacterium]